MSRAVPALLLFLLPAVAWAHPLDLASLRVDPRDDGSVDVRFDLSEGAPGVLVTPRPVTPCSELRATSTRHVNVLRVRATWDCGPGGPAAVSGRLAGAKERELETIFVVAGRTSVLERGTEAFGDNTPNAGVFVPHLRAGARHILAGVDHLLFVALLFVLAPSRRSLLIAVTGFTAGHSITLAWSALGGATPAAAPTEVLIAASVFAAALEAVRPAEERGFIGKRPGGAALVFGLLHGFGFAGSLAATGLPRGAEAPALLGFNLGVEVGQLVFLAGCGLVSCVLKRDPARILAYAAGTASAFLILDRLRSLG